MDNKFCYCKNKCIDNRCICFKQSEYCAEDCKCTNCDNLRITLEDKKFVKECIESYYLRIKNSYSDALEGVKQELECQLDEQSDQDYDLTEYDINELENELEIDLPPTLIAFLIAKFRIRIEWHEFILSENPYNIIEQMKLKEYRDIGLLLIASGPSGDPVFLDIKQPKPEDEYPVIVINHDLIDNEHWSSRELLQPYIEVVAQSFEKFLYALCNDKLSYNSKWLINNE
jgi:hypothetical protein